MNDLFDRTDEELVALYAEGNNGAFDVLLKRHQVRTFNYIYYIVKDKELANDIFQETFVKAIMTIKQGRYTENGKFPAWISRIAHNLIIDFFRQEKADNYVITDNENMDIFNRKELSEGTVEDTIVQNRCSQTYQGPSTQPEGSTCHALLQKHELQRNCRPYQSQY